jgi:hypothetical protein
MAEGRGKMDENKYLNSAAYHKAFTYTMPEMGKERGEGQKTGCCDIFFKLRFTKLNIYSDHGLSHLL